ncbi:MAG TPA: M28 family peptidase [Planctomycetota bacterium]|nr:M28 family peptidase [Planctomycetota bacterium]
MRRTAPPLAALLAAALLAAAPAELSAQAGDLLDPRLRELFHESLSGERAKEHVVAITRHHRVQGSRGYRKAAQYVIEELRRCGFEVPELPVTAGAFLAAGDLDADWMGGGSPPWTAPGGVLAGDRPAAWIESFPSDGRVSYQTWQSPSGWDIEAAELRLMEPSEAPGGERLVGFPEIAMSVITYSNPGDVTAELVWVGSGEREEDYAAQDVRGKFVLATGYGGAVHRRAVLEHGAAAVVCFLDDARAAEHPDMLQYTGMWPRTDELARTTFGFNLTNRQGSRLRDLLLAGRPVVLRGSVQGTGLEPYWMDLVVATIPGSERPDEELVFSAHLDHPKESANDNASGSAALLDIARALKELIDGGRLPRPKRTLRFLWVPEWNGTMAYIDGRPELAGPALGGRVLANLNLDMVGEDLELLHSKLILTRTPDSLPSCLNDVVENMAQMVDGLEIRTPRGGASAFNWRMTPYSGGSDHMMFIDRKIPAVMFSHSPDYTHHTSEDTPDKVDPVELERCELIATGAAWFLANLEERQAEDLVALVTAEGLRRIGRTWRDGPVETEAQRRAARHEPENVLEQSVAIVMAPILVRGAVARAIGGALEGLERTALATTREALAVRSVLEFNDAEGVRDAVSHATEALIRASGLLDLDEDESEAESLAAWQRFLETGVHPDAPAVPAPRTVPVRRTRGPLDFGLPESRLPADEAAWFRSPDCPITGDMRFELVNLIDGRRDVEWIATALSAQFQPVGTADVQRYVEGLVEAGVAAWTE